MATDPPGAGELVVRRLRGPTRPTRRPRGDLATRSFLDLRRLGTSRPVLSLDHLVHRVLGETSPIS